MKLQLPGLLDLSGSTIHYVSDDPTLPDGAQLRVAFTDTGTDWQAANHHDDQGKIRVTVAPRRWV